MNTVLITGANRGIGLELVKQYVSEGWKVLACCRKPNEASALQEIARSPSCQILKLDLSNLNEIVPFSQSLKNETIDVLINNAGVVGYSKLILGQLDAAKALETFTVNTISPLLLTQALLPQMEKSQHKIIVNMSSTMGSIALNTEGGYYYYRSTKTALNSITKTLAIDLKNKNFIVIALHPGWVKTDMGGENAKITTDESVRGMRHVIANLKAKDTGAFLNYKNEILPW